MNYYNEFNPDAAAWLRQLIEDGQIPKGIVDDRSITEVSPSDLRGFVQAHFFAGIGGWPLALRKAGWPEDRPVWTASLPCQPFSSAGKQHGTGDERHLWPVFESLVRECHPPNLFGEQVASKPARLDWLPGVCMDLQKMGYSATAVDLCCPCAGEVGEGRILRGDQDTWGRVILGAPHIRQRLYWVARRMADADSERHYGIDPLLRRDELGRNAGDIPQATGGGAASRMADTPSDRRQRDGATPEAEEGRQQGRDTSGELPSGSEGCTLSSGLGDSGCERREMSVLQSAHCGEEISHRETNELGCTGAHLLMSCRDGKTRRTQSGIFPLVAGLPRGVVPSGDPSLPEYANATPEARKMRLHGYGNAINTETAALFIKSFIETE